MLITIIIAVALIFLDQLTKILTEQLMTLGQKQTLIPYILNAKFVYNKGAAWGMLDDNTFVLAIISLIASLVLGYFIFKTNNWKTEKLKAIGLTLAFSGAVGNLIDRSFASFNAPFRPAVVDMIDFEPLNWISRLFGGSGFPTFNMADAYLVVGLIIFSIDLIFLSERRNKNAQQTNSNDESSGDETGQGII